VNQPEKGVNQPEEEVNRLEEGVNQPTRGRGESTRGKGESVTYLCKEVGDEEAEEDNAGHVANAGRVEGLVVKETGGDDRRPIPYTLRLAIKKI
jgi:hypothetical protein